MHLYVAGHGHSFEKRPDFIKWLKKHDSNFLVSFAYPDMGRLRLARKVRREKRKQRKGAR